MNMKAEEENGVIEEEINRVGMLNLGEFKPEDRKEEAGRFLKYVNSRPALKKSMIDNCSDELYRVSPKNRILILSQKPYASQVMGSYFWWKEGFIIKKGIKACYYYAPKTIKKENPDKPGEQIEVVKGFKLVPGFDIKDVKEREEREE